MADWSKGQVEERIDTHCANTLMTKSDERVSGVRGQQCKAMRLAKPVSSFRERGRALYIMF